MKFRLLARILIGAYLALALFFYFAQELVIFPVLRAKIFQALPAYKAVPENIDQFFITTEDGAKLDVWASTRLTPNPEAVAIIFHGNGETVHKQSFIPFFNQLNIAAITYDYRGYGKSTGWPNPNNFLSDTEEVWRALQNKYSLKPEKVILLGNSIGTGPASYLAQKIQPASLILLSAYYNFRSLVKERTFYSLFSPFLRYDIWTNEYLEKLGQKTCMIVAHGQKDKIIPFGQFQQLAALPSLKNANVIIAKDARHADIFSKVESELRSATKNCLQKLGS